MSVTTLSQRDERRKDIKLGTSSKTIGQAGCTITCLASILGLTPEEVNEKLTNNGGYADGNLVIWDQLPKIFPQIKSATRVWEYDNETVKNNLPCLVEVNGSRIGADKHWVVYCGNQQMMDPWYGNIKSTSYYHPTGYAIVKVGIIEEEPITPDMDWNNQTIIPFENSVGDMELGAARSAIKDGRRDSEALKKLREDYDKLAKIHKSVKDDFEKEIAEVEKKNTLYREFLVRLAKETGATQNMEDVEAKVSTLVKDAQELRDVKDERPLTKHPFEGAGKRTREIQELTIKLMKKWLQKK